MSIALSFDTLQYANKLKAAGVPEKQAEVQAEAFKELIEDNLATKRDLKELEANLKRDIKEIDERITILEYKLVVKMGSLLVVGLTVLVALMKLLHL